MLVKFQGGSKVTCVFISSVVLPIPPALVACPLVSISQKESDIVAVGDAADMSPPGVGPVTRPVE